MFGECNDVVDYVVSEEWVDVVVLHPVSACAGAHGIHRVLHEVECTLGDGTHDVFVGGGTDRYSSVAVHEQCEFGEDFRTEGVLDPQFASDEVFSNI